MGEIKVSYICFENVCKFYKNGDNITRAADGISFTAEKGEFTVIVGPSGAGKTTVLNMLGGMDKCDEGKIMLDSDEISAFDRRRLTEYRRYDVGFVFQFYNLVQNLTAKENVELATEICKEPLDAEKTLEKVGLKDRINNFPAQLSGGEQQRLCLIRCLAVKPKVLLLDESLSGLDDTAAEALLTLVRRALPDTAVLLITHQSGLISRADTVLTLT